MGRPNRQPSADVPFKLVSSYEPRGDQGPAIEALQQNLKAGVKYQTLLGVTGSGKTFTIANVIALAERPTLVIAPNKTLAAQLYAEFRAFFPENRVRFFVSYYDYYQPEAYLPASDTYIEKDAAINEEIDKMRHSATKALLEGRDTIIVASVSCIYGLGAPEDYFSMMFYAEQGDVLALEDVLHRLVAMQYTRADMNFVRGSFRVRGDTIDIFPSDEDQKAVRLVFFGDAIEEIREIDALSGKTTRRLSACAVYPVSHYVTSREALQRAIKSIRAELEARLIELKQAGQLLEAQRLESRTLYDLELLQEIGFCPGIENYSRHLAGRPAGSAPTTLLDYFPHDFLLVIDESHVTLPQLGGMYRGDQSRKKTLVEYGFRLPSALDNRPLSIAEFWERTGQTIFVSATPGEEEISRSQGRVIELLNRPTGVLDPEVQVRPARYQVDDLLGEIKSTVAQGDRVLVTTLTKRMAENLSDYLREIGVKSRYLHSDINALERVEILRALRKGEFDVLIGINLLREGLDLVEVSLVAILDADKEGFLRSARSLIQTMGRAARNVRGRAILYADVITDSIRIAVAETERRRSIQRAFNEKHHIVPTSARPGADMRLLSEYELEGLLDYSLAGQFTEIPKDPREQLKLVERLKSDMLAAAARHEFEQAAMLRDAIKTIQQGLLKI